MEYDRYLDRAGRKLEPSDLARLERTVFKPALRRCGVIMSPEDGSPVYFASDEAVRHDDGQEYRHYFDATINKTTSLLQYSVCEVATDTLTLDQLSLDERNIVIAQFQQSYVRHGGKLSELGKSLTWTALYDPAVHDAVALSIESSSAFLFTGSRAKRNFTTERRITFNNVVTKLDKHSYDAEPGDVAYRYDPVDTEDEWWDGELVSDLDELGEDMCMMTTRDMDTVISILDEMKLVSYGDRDKYVRDN